jgi:hypothetical protein
MVHMQTQAKVSVGITTIIGWLTAIGGAIPIVVKLLEEGQKGLTLAGPEKWAAILAVVSLGITQIGRYAQAHAQISAGGTAAAAVAGATAAQAATPRPGSTI